MALLPEIIFRALLVRGIRTIRQDSRLMDQLFRNLDLNSAKEMREFFKTQSIFIDINYPRDGLKLPAIVMLLRAEQEGYAFVGDTMGHGQVPDEMSYEDDGEALGGAASMNTMSGEGPVVFGPFTAAGGTNNTLRIDESRWNIDQFKIGQHTIHLIGGLGTGQQRGIIANGRNTVMVAPAWSTVPDDTTVFSIRGPVNEVIGEPRAIYDRASANTVERIGGVYNLSYQVQVIGPNPEFTIYLASIVKAIFTIGRQFLEGQGVMDMKLGATDFVPKPEYQPDFSYMRALNVDFSYPFDVFIGGDVIDSIRVVLEQINTDTGSVEIISDTVVT